MTAKSFETAQGLADYQAEREVQEALCVQQMTPSERFAWLEANWGRLQNNVSLLNTNVQRPPAAARCYASVEEKNRFDDERELRQALQIHLAHQK